MSRFKKSHLKYVVGVLVMVGVIASSVGSCSRKARPDDPVEGPARLAVPAGAAVVKVERQVLPLRVPVMGTAVSEEVVRLSARMPSYVTKVAASAGEHVKKGQVLVSLDDREIREQLAAAEAQFKQADIEYERVKKLVEAQAATDQARVAAESARNSAKAQVERATAVLSYAQILAPMDGTVTERRVEVGDLAGPGQMLMSVYDPNRMRLECAVPVRLIQRLPLDREVEIRLDRPERPLKGKVSEIVSEVDPVTRSQKVKVRIEGKTDDILPGSFGRLWVEGEPAETIRVPDSAVYRMGQLDLVQVVEGKEVRRRLVKTGPAADGKIEILSGLNPGESVLVQPVKGE